MQNSPLICVSSSSLFTYWDPTPEVPGSELGSAMGGDPVVCMYAGVSSPWPDDDGLDTFDDSVPYIMPDE